MHSKSLFSRLKLSHRSRKSQGSEAPGKQDAGSISGSSATDASDSPGIVTQTQDPAGVQDSEPGQNSTVPQLPSLSTSQRLWNQAYSSIENDGETAKLAQAYVKTLITAFATEESSVDPLADTLIETEDPVKRQVLMRDLVEKGREKVAVAAQVTKRLGDAAQFILSAKAMVDLAIQNIPQAALPWAGVCVGLQILLNPINAMKSNEAGISYVISKMDWYCSLTEHILSQSNIVVGKENYQAVQQKLEVRVISLYKALLLYQMKSACSFYRHQSLVFLRGLANLDDWDAELKSVTDAEADLQKDLDQFNTQHAKSLLGQLVEIAKEREGLLRDNLALQKEFHKDEMDTQCLQDLRLTDPRHDKTRIEQTKGGLLPDAYRWILDNADFRRWRDEEQNQLLWIKGDPGKGKTMLLCGIADELQSSSGEKCLLSFFFCQATDLRINNAAAVLRGLIYMILEQQPSLIPHAREKYDHAGKALFEDANSWVALSEIFTNILQDPSLVKTYLIIDALDECVKDLPKLLKLIIQTSSMSHVKWVISSRNWSSIEDGLSHHGSRVVLGLESEQNGGEVSHAVDTYIDHCISKLAAIQNDKLLQDQVRDKMQQKANGTFLWVSLVFKELEDVSSWEVLEVVEEIPADLEDVYDRMMAQIHALKRRSPELCRGVLAVATAAYRPLHLAELRALSGLPPNITSAYEHIMAIVNMCGSFLTIRDNIVYIIHQSAQDYLSANTFLFPQGVTDTHYDIFSRSLCAMTETLRRDIYDLASPGFPIGEVKQPNPDPLVAVNYSCVYWVDHLQNGATSKKVTNDLQDGGSVDKFLRQSYLYWVEAISLLRSISKGILSTAKLDRLLQGHTSQLAKLVQDGLRFLQYHRWIIENNPLQLYASALIFSPTRSIIRSQFKDQEPEWVTLKPIMEIDWSACLQTLQGHQYDVTSVAFSHDSKVLASASRDGTVRIWSTDTGECLKTLEDNMDNVGLVIFSHDSKLLASAEGSRQKGFLFDPSLHWPRVRIWSTETGECQETLEAYEGEIQSIAFSFDSSILVSATNETDIFVWSSGTGNNRQTFKGHEDTVLSAAFSPDGKLLASCSRDGFVRIWSIETGECHWTFENQVDYYDFLAFSYDSKLLATPSSYDKVQIWSTETGERRGEIWGRQMKGVRSIAFSPDSKLLAASWQSEIQVWSSDTGERQQTLEGHISTVNSVVFSPNSKLLASAARDHTVRIWSSEMGGHQERLEGHSRRITSVHVSPDSKTVASVSYDNTIRIWSCETGQCEQTIEVPSDDHINLVAFSSDWKLIASNSEDHKAMIWSTETGECQKELLGGHSFYLDLEFSPDSKLVAASENDSTVWIWSAETGKCQQNFRCGDLSIDGLMFSPDSRLLAVALEKMVQLWSSETGECLQTLKGHDHSVQGMGFSPDSKLVVSASCDNTVRIWSSETGKCQKYLYGCSRRPGLVTFSPDLKLVAAIDEDASVRIWSTETENLCQIVSVGMRSRRLLLTQDGSNYHLITDGGTVLIDGMLTSAKDTSSAAEGSLVSSILPTPRHLRTQHIGCGINPYDGWITLDEKNILWLPADVRSDRVLVFGSTVAIACASGRVIFIRMSTSGMQSVTRTSSKEYT